MSPSNGDEGRGSVLSLLDAEALGLGSSVIVGQRAPVRQVNWATGKYPSTLDYELAPHLPPTFERDLRISSAGLFAVPFSSYDDDGIH